MNLDKNQEQIAYENLGTTVFVEGMMGLGKTSAGIERVKQLIQAGVSADSILIIVPQAVLGLPYHEALKQAQVDTARDVQIATLGKLAYETVDLFFPLIADEVGFERPLEPPHFLSLELVQYYMTRFIEPEINKHDYFNSVHITRSRLYTQIVDNLNKASLVGFDYQTLAKRLKSAWRGDVEQQYIYDDVQASVQLFRDKCRQYNLLDFSYQVDLFVNHLWTKPEPRNYLTQQYRHLIVDNIEEDNPATHDLLRDWLPECASTVVMLDSGGGYRRFLGADPVQAYKLKDLCEVHIELAESYVMSDAVTSFQSELGKSLDVPIHIKANDTDAREALVYTDNRYHPQMVDWVAEQVSSLVHDEGVNPQAIVILAPYLPDALRFSLQARLDEADIPNRAHRPSRALREEPATRTLITLAKIAHPQWEMMANNYDLAFALTSSIQDLDLIRARLLADTLYLNGALLPFSQIENERFQERITFDFGTRYDVLVDWLTAYINDTSLPVDVFFSKLFGEVLSQPGFGFHDNYDSANTAANLIDSAKEFRQTVGKIEPDLDTSSEYVRMVDSCVIANQYVREWQLETQDAVLVAPAYTFLLSNTPVDYQFWVNIGSNSWSQRLLQPLTQPYVLSRQWEEGRVWTDADEEEANRENLSAVTLGLIRRCRKRIYLGISEYGEQGYEQRGSLLMAVQSMLRRLQKEHSNV